MAKADRLCWKKAQVSPTATTIPIQDVAQLVKYL
jgi:hypothetical protein